MRALLVSGLATEALWLASLFLPPWNRDVVPFLSLWGAAFAVYALAWRSLRRGLPANAASSSRLPLILAAGVLFRLTLFFAPPTLSDDIHRYLWEGRLQNAGVNPYRYPPDDPRLIPLRDENYVGINHKSVPAVYPPLAQLVFRLAAGLSPTLTAQKAAFAAFDLAVLFLLIAYLRRKGRPPERVFLYAWNPLVLVEFSSSGHMDSLGLFFLLAGLFAYESARPRTAGLAWGLCFLGKLASLPLLPWMLLKRAGRRGLAAFVLAIAAGYLFFVQWPLAETGRFLFSGTGVYVKDWHFNASLYALFSRLTPLSGGAIKLLSGALWASVAFALARRLPEKNILAYAAVLWALLLAFSPVVHPWYAAWLVPFLCFFPLWSGILFTGLVGLSYLVLREYAASGVWSLPAWVPWVEYGVPFAVLSVELVRTGRGRFASPAPGRSEPAGPRPLAVCVIVPALNEEKALPMTLAELPRENVSRVIVVDNGSTDGTAAAARAAGATVVREERRGYGRAVRAGLRHLPPDCGVVVVLDADHSDFPEDLPSLLAPLERDEADFVIGSRVLGGALPGSLTPQQRFGNRLACLLIHLFFGKKFTDLGPFRAIRRDLLEKLDLKDETFGWNVEMQVKALRAGARVAEAPVRYRPRTGASKISGTAAGTVGAGIKIIWTILRQAAAPGELRA